MGYNAGILDKRVKVAKRAAEQGSGFGSTGQQKYEWVRMVGDHAFWAGVPFVKGTKAMHEGALDAYTTKMFRFRWQPGIDEWCLLQYMGKWYQITSFNPEYRNNIIQITAVTLANQNVNIEEPLLDADSLVLMDADGVYLTADN